MSEFQLTHVALVGARISAFHPYGFQARTDLAMRRVAPETAGIALEKLPPDKLRGRLREQLPLWIHNIITDPEFPNRERLLMPIRRFEGELHDSKHDEVVSAVLSKGFRNQTFDPFDLPPSMPVRQRCAILAHIRVWQEAYRRLEQDLLELMVAQVGDITNWSEYAKHPSHATIQ